MKNVFKKAALAAALVGAGFAASATPIIGVANLSFGLVTISAGEVDWNPPGNPGKDLAATYGGFFTAAGSNSGSFAGAPFAGITAGLVQDLSSNAGQPIPFGGDGTGISDGNFVPIGAGLTNKFLQFSAQPGWIFNATFLVPGNPLAFTPYNLTQVGQNVSATISLNGTACDAGATGLATVCDLTDDLTKWTGIFSAQFTNQTIAGLIAAIGAGSVSANNTWSGTVEARALPEPGSIALLGLGLIGLAAARRRKSV